MSKLASGTVRAIEFLMESLAQFGLVVLGHVWLSVELKWAMSERAELLECADACELPVLTHLSFVL